MVVIAEIRNKFVAFLSER